jgi:sulfite reductase (NADPH) flavoprotein alpha-component
MNEALQRRPAIPLDEPERSRLDSAIAGFSAAQLFWASGYLAGLAATGGPRPAGRAGAESHARLTVLYGSQTGNGRRLAEKLGAAAAARGLAVDVLNMADYPTSRLKRERLLAIVVSTHGEGDPPDDALALHRYLGGPRVPTLGSLRYWVLALGDSSYENFCASGRDFDLRLAAAGAQRLATLVECDLEYEAAAAQWSARLLDEAEQALGRAEAAGAPVLRVVPPPRATGNAACEATVLLNQRLTGRGSSKDVRHLELDVADAAPRWEAGDSLGVTIRNPDRVVEPLLQALGLDGNAAGPAGRTLREELVNGREITVLNRPFLEAWAGRSRPGTCVRYSTD